MAFFDMPRGNSTHAIKCTIDGFCHQSIMIFPILQGNIGTKNMSAKSQTNESNPSYYQNKINNIAIPYKALGLCVAIFEFTVIVFASIINQKAYQQFFMDVNFDLNADVGIGIIAGFLYISLVHSEDLYKLTNLANPSRNFSRIAVCCCLVFLTLATGIFLLKASSDLARGAFVSFAGLMLALCCAVRHLSARLVTKLLESGAVLGRATFLIGQADEIAGLTAHDLLHRYGRREVGRLVLDRHTLTQEAIGTRIPDAIALARTSRTEEFLLAVNIDQWEDVACLRTALRVSPLPVRLLPTKVFRSLMADHGAMHGTGDDLVELQHAPMSLLERVAKRLADVLIASFAILALCPIMIITALAVKLDSAGPIIFKQRRNGFNERLFVIFKFRTMRVTEDGDHIVQAKPGDQRVTRVGRALRRTSVDELPQLFNVLRGEMSLVGPRPHALAHDAIYKRLIGDYCMRHHVKPGMTGWAQVHGFRGRTSETEDMRRRVDLDLWYINNWSLLLDLRILAKTAFAVLRSDAY